MTRLKLAGGLVTVGLMVLGCTGGEMFVEEKAAPRFGLPMVRPSHRLAVGALAEAGGRGVFVKVDPYALSRFQAIEGQGLRMDVDAARGRLGYHLLKVRPLRANARYPSASGREVILAAAAGDHVIVVDFGAVPGEGRYSELLPIFRPDLPAVSITLDLDKIAESGGYTDVTNELLYALVRAKDITAFWQAHVKGNPDADSYALTARYHELHRLRRIEAQALATESEFRRERYFAWVARHFGDYDLGRTGNRPSLKAPGFARPFEIGSSKLAREHGTYHKPHVIVPDLSGSTLYCRIRAGARAEGLDRTYVLPYVPPVGDDADGGFLTLAEYKRRWYNYFKKEIIAEAQNSPYSRSVYPHQARFPDHATPSSFFMNGLKAAVREQRLKARVGLLTSPNKRISARPLYLGR